MAHDKRGVRTPSRHLTLVRLREIEANHGIARSGTEYAPDELRTRIQELEQAKADALDFESTPVIESQTREEWLTAATEALRADLFKRKGAEIPTVRLSVGFPGGGSARKRIGEYWKAIATTDGVPQVFVSPILGEPIQALETLVHELVHAVHPEAGHKGPFKRLAKAIGLTGKMTATKAGAELRAELELLADTLGPYPHASINLSMRKKQTTRLCKVECESCGYTARVTRKWIDEMGAPLCPCSNEPMGVV